MMHACMEFYSYVIFMQADLHSHFYVCRSIRDDITVFRFIYRETIGDVFVKILQHRKENL